MWDNEQLEKKVQLIREKNLTCMKQENLDKEISQMLIPLGQKEESEEVKTKKMSTFNEKWKGQLEARYSCSENCNVGTLQVILAGKEVLHSRRFYILNESERFEIKKVLKFGDLMKK